MFNVSFRKNAFKRSSFGSVARMYCVQNQETVSTKAYVKTTPCRVAFNNSPVCGGLRLPPHAKFTATTTNQMCVELIRAQTN